MNTLATSARQAVVRALRRPAGYARTTRPQTHSHLNPDHHHQGR